jgi:hypothetical protein
MTNSSRRGWVNDMTGSPKIKGNLEISMSEDGIFIGGDPDALRSLARLLVWLADVDQESLPGMPDGERCHVHLYARKAPGPFGDSLTPFSQNTELCRLDAKRTGDFPSRYQERKKTGRKKRTRE